VLLIRLARHEGHQSATARIPIVLSWGASLAVVGVALWILPRVHPLEVEPPDFPYPALLFDSLWPVAAGIALVALAFLLIRRSGRIHGFPGLAPGDVPVVGGSLDVPIRVMRRFLLREPFAQPMIALARRWYALNIESEPDDTLVQGETALTRWEAGAGLMILVVAILAVVIAHG